MPHKSALSITRAVCAVKQVDHQLQLESVAGCTEPVLPRNCCSARRMKGAAGGSRREAGTDRRECRGEVRRQPNASRFAERLVRTRTEAVVKMARTKRRQESECVGEDMPDVQYSMTADGGSHERKVSARSRRRNVGYTSTFMFSG